MPGQGLYVPGLAPHIGRPGRGPHSVGGGGNVPTVAPAAPILSLTSNSSDNTPNFNVDLPYGVGDGTDAQAGDVLRIRRSTDNWATSADYLIYTLTSADITATSVSAASTGALANNTYLMEGRLERAAGNSPWSADVTALVDVIAFPTVTYLGANHDNYSSPVLSFPLDIGTATATRRIFVLTTNYNTGAYITGLTVGGVALAMDVHVGVDAGVPDCEIWSGVVPTGSGVQTVAITWPSAAGYTDRFAQVWSVDALATGVVNTSIGSPGTVAVLAGDLIFSVCIQQGSPPTAADFATSTRAPDMLENFLPFAGSNSGQASALWKVASSDAGNFQTQADGGGVGAMVTASYR